VGAFLREWCVVGAGERVNVKTLFKAYKAWADDNGHKATAQQTFGKDLHSLVPG
jgi:putative DNA primase/helicase